MSINNRNLEFHKRIQDMKRELKKELDGHKKAKEKQGYLQRQIGSFDHIDDEEGFSQDKVRRINILMEENNELEEKLSVLNNDQSDHIKMLRQRNEILKEKLQRSRRGNHEEMDKKTLEKELEKLTHKSLMLQTKLNSIPGIQEQFQYQKRLLELDNEMARQHGETVRFYSLFNSLEEQKRIIGREIAILDSILDALSYGNDLVNYKINFLQQVGDLVKEIDSRADIVKRKLENDKEVALALKDSLKRVRDKEQMVLNLLKDINSEVEKNNILRKQFRDILLSK